MPDATVLEGAAAHGLANVREVSAPGMISLKAELAAPEVAAAVRAATGCPVPGTRGIVAAGGARAGWMAPDELLLIVPREEVPEACAALEARLGALPHLAADVSDMRAVVRVEHGLAAREAVAKLAPVDLAPGRFEAGTLRRTRLAQVPAAFWWEEDGITLVCFRSVARYAFDVLAQAAAEGGAVDYFTPA